MMAAKHILLVAFIASMVSSIRPENIVDLKSYLIDVNKNLANLYNEQVALNWKSEVLEMIDEMTKEEQSQQINHRIMNYIKLVSDDLKMLNDSSLLSSIGYEPIVMRQLKKLPKLGYEILDATDFQEITEATMNMSAIYKTVKLCSYQDPENCNLTLIPDVQDILHTTTDIKEIEYYWLEWRTKSGTRVRSFFENFVKLYRKTAELNGFERPSSFWYRNFDDSDTVLPELRIIIEKLHPLFEVMHAHVRSLLRQKYGPELVKYAAPYPQQLAEIFIGEAYRDQEGKNLQFPYPNEILPNITEALLQQNYTAEQMFQLSESFYVSIGMPELPRSFWSENALPKIDSSEKYLTCLGKAYNYYENELVTLSYCPHIDRLRFFNMIESMSDVYYYKSYKDQLTVFQDEPFPEFSEAIAKVFSLSMSSPRYLEKLEFFPVGSFGYEKRINRLYFQGLKEIFLLPILYTLDKYRVDILNNETNSFGNCEFWNLNEKYTGAVAPVKRSNQDFDAPSKLLVGVNEIYSGVIIGRIVQFQIYKNFCEKIGQYKKDDPEWPLDNCDLSGHPELGASIQSAMALGSSTPWKYVLETLTGEKELDPSGFLEYFQPLMEWLTENNQKNNIEVGWVKSNQCGD